MPGTRRDPELRGRRPPGVFRVPEAGGGNELDGANVDRPGVAGDAAGDQCAVPHLLGVQPDAARHEHDRADRHHAGDYTYQQAINTYGANFTLREPRKTFRFTVATTF
jgi:hypothetical protein